MPHEPFPDLPHAIDVLYISFVDVWNLLLTPASSHTAGRLPLLFLACITNIIYMIMHIVSQVSMGLALLVVASSLAAAGHVPVQHKRAGEADRLLGKRQAAQSCADTLCASSDLLATVPSSLRPKTTAPPATTIAPLDSTTSTTGESSSTTTDAGSGDGGGQADILVSVAQPSLCSESILQFSSSYSVPTGNIRIAAETEGWGVEGSIWNITANDGSSSTTSVCHAKGAPVPVSQEIRKRTGKLLRMLMVAGKEYHCDD